MGFWPPGLEATAGALSLTALLFAAPLYERLVIDGAWSAWVRLEPLRALWSDWPTWRNLVAVRSLMLANFGGEAGVRRVFYTD